MTTEFLWNSNTDQYSDQKIRWPKNSFERSIFQTFWKVHCCPDFLFLKLETSNFGYLFIFWFPLTVQSFSKVGQHWFKTFYKGPPFDVFWFCNLPKIHRGDPYKMSNINVVQSYWNFAQLKEIKKLASSQNLKSLTQKTKNRGNNALSGRFGKYSFDSNIFWTKNPKSSHCAMENQFLRLNNLWTKWIFWSLLTCIEKHRRWRMAFCGMFLKKIFMFTFECTFRAI